MKYFTPQLLAAYGADDATTRADAEARWDEACERYTTYLDTIKSDFPPGLRRAEDSYNLHDAKVRSLGQRDGALVIVLQLDTPPQPLVTFTYDLLAPPRIDPEALPAELRSKAAVPEWQYDEVEKVEGAPPTWQQSVLLSNGWELSLHLRDIKVEEAQALLPAPRNGAVATAGLVPQSA